MRLGKEVIPENYNIEIDVNLESHMFSGKEVVSLKINEKTDKIKLHSADLEIKECKINGEKVKHALAEDEELLIVEDFGELDDECELEIEFSGELSDNLAGFYKSKYFDEKGDEKYLATTQFEPADARRAFPCFDEPDFKASFGITLGFDKDLVGISNMPVKEEKTDGDKKKVVFETTPKMSSYLVYLGVGEFEFIEDKLGEVDMRIITTPGKKEQGKFALECSKKFLKYYNDYFGIPYPLPKLDHIAIPDFASGAMENWGAITYREVELLFDEKISSTVRKQRIAEVVGHEMAHQWFGNLVTMDWWNDLWLNESFATWMAYKISDEFFPEWSMWSKFVNEEVAIALNLDGLKSSHPIAATVGKPHEVNQIFDAISYNKGGSLLRMLENYLGEDVFMKGLRIYMKNYQYKNAKTEDLWKSMGEVTDIDVKGIMNGWIEKTGYPILDVGFSENKLSLSQRRFMLEGNGDDSVWKLPVSVVGFGSGEEGKSHEFIMENKEESVDFDHGVLKINSEQSGFYRVNYNQKILDGLGNLIKEGKLSNLDRWGLQNDLFALALSGRIKFSSYLEFVEFYKHEKDYLVCTDIASNLYRSYLITSGDLREEIGKHTLAFYKNVFSWLGWDVSKDKDENYRALRSSILIFLSRLEDKEVLEEGKKRFEEFLEDKDSLEADLRTPVFNIVAWNGDQELYDKFVELYENSNSPEDKRRFLWALVGFKDKEILKKALDFALTPSVRAQDSFVPIVSAARNPSLGNYSWEWVKNNWNELEKRYGKGGNVKMLEVFIFPLGLLNDSGLEKEIKAFFESGDSLHLVSKALNQSLERLRINSNFAENNERENK